MNRAAAGTDPFLVELTCEPGKTVDGTASATASGAARTDAPKPKHRGIASTVRESGLVIWLLLPAGVPVHPMPRTSGRVTC
jgi:hypothetical protein